MARKYDKVVDESNKPAYDYLKEDGKFIKSRLWEFVAYEEDISIDEVINYLNTEGYSGWVSPIHNQDVNLETGEIKKAHYHIYLSSTGAVGAFAMLRIMCKLGLLPPQRKDSLQGSFDYSYHKNEDTALTGKFVYDFNDIKTFGGFDKQKYKVNKSAVVSKVNLLNMARASGCINICQFTNYLLERGEYAYLDLLIEKAYFFSQYLKFNLKGDLNDEK